MRRSTDAGSSWGPIRMVASDPLTPGLDGLNLGSATAMPDRAGRPSIVLQFVRGAHSLSRAPLRLLTSHDGGETWTNQSDYDWMVLNANLAAAGVQFFDPGPGPAAILPLSSFNHTTAPSFLPRTAVNGTEYIYTTRAAAEAACRAEGFVGLCSKDRLEVNGDAFSILFAVRPLTRKITIAGTLGLRVWLVLGLGGLLDREGPDRLRRRWVQRPQRARRRLVLQPAGRPRRRLRPVQHRMHARTLPGLQADAKRHRLWGPCDHIRRRRPALARRRQGYDASCR